MKTNLLLLCTALLAAGCHSSQPKVWYQLGRSGAQTQQDAADCHYRANHHQESDYVRGINPGFTMLINNSARDTLFENCMAAKGYAYGDPIEARFNAVNKQIDWFTANPHAGLGRVNGELVSYRSAEIAAMAQEFDDLFGGWRSWCVIHPDGGIIPDGTGETLTIPRHRMSYIRRELAAAWDRWKPLRHEILGKSNESEPPKPASSAQTQTATH